jgi:hypothetical protein
MSQQNSDGLNHQTGERMSNLNLPQDGDLNWGEPLRAAINQINDSKATINHLHNQYALVSNTATAAALNQLETEVNQLQKIIETVQNTLKQVIVDLDNIEISSVFSNMSFGIRLRLHTTPQLFITSWNLKIRQTENGAVFYDEDHNTSNIWITSGDLITVNAPRNLYFQITLRVGQNTKTVHRTHNYIKIQTDFELGLELLKHTINQELTIPNFIEAFCNNANALILLSNQLQHSLPLARNIANNQEGTL